MVFSLLRWDDTLMPRRVVREVAVSALWVIVLASTLAAAGQSAHVAATGAPASAAAARSASPSPGPTPFYTTERLTNGGGEVGIGSPDMEHVVKPSGWGTSENFTVVEYGGPGDLPLHDNSSHVLNTDSLGKNFFAGGPKSDLSAAWQNVDLTPKASDIGDGAHGDSKVRFVISAWLGGRLAGPDYAQVFVRFFGDRQNESGTKKCGTRQEPEAPCAVLGPVSREMRHATSILIPKACWQTVPAGSRSAKVSMVATRVSGYDNDAFFDKVSFILYGPHNTIPKRVPKCTSSPANALRRANIFAVDTRSVRCLWWTFTGVKLMLAFVFGAFALIVMPTSVRWWIRGVVTAVLAVAGGAVAQILLHLEPVFHAGDTGCMLDQSWAPSTVGFALLAGYSAFGTFYVFAHRWHFTVPWKNTLLFAGAFIVTFIIALGVIGHYSPKTDELASLDTALLVVALGMTYMMLAIPVEIQRFPDALKWGLFAVLLAPVVEPSTAAWNLWQIKNERVLHENQHRFFKVPAQRQNASGVRFEDVLFYTPTALDYGASAQIIFRAHLVSPGETKGCITPRLIAPGFLLRDVLVDPVPIPHAESTAAPRPDVHWEWVATSLHSGRQFAFMNVFLSPKCRRFDKTGDSEPAYGTEATPSRGNATENQADQNAFTSVFDQTESVWVARQFIALDDFAGALPWLSLLFAIITVIIAAFDLRSKQLAPRAAPTSPSAPPPTDVVAAGTTAPKAAEAPSAQAQPAKDEPPLPVVVPGPRAEPPQPQPQAPAEPPGPAEPPVPVAAEPETIEPAKPAPLDDVTPSSESPSDAEPSSDAEPPTGAEPPTDASLDNEEELQPDDAAPEPPPTKPPP